MTAPDAMPERVKRYELVQKGTYESYGAMERDDEYGEWVDYDDYAALESRLLAAEARVREVEEQWKHISQSHFERAERAEAKNGDDATALANEMCAERARACEQMMGQIATLRAERDALVEALVRVVAHTGHLSNAPSELLESPLSSSARIANRALAEREKGGMGTHKPDCIGGYSCEADCGRTILARREKEGA